MWDDMVRDRRGLPVASLAEAGEANLAGARFVAVLCHDDGILPAVAAVEPAQVVAHLTLSDSGPVAARATAANRFLEQLAANGVDAYLVKFGRVGGADPERSIEITRDHAAAILDAIAGGTVEWEQDPDFGYRTAVEIPGIEGRDRFILVPRFLYARTERVYEHAAMVPQLKRERVARLSALDGLDAAILDAVR
jgi:phosphoenolpyruvate carboxykinase (ATP)